MSHQVTLIPGDGTGPEITRATRRVLEATGVSFAWDVQDAGIDVYQREGTPLPARVLDSLRRTKVGLKGPITTPVGTGFRSVNVSLCQTAGACTLILLSPNWIEKNGGFVARHSSGDGASKPSAR